MQMNLHSPIQYNAATIGAAAQDQLRLRQEARVIGITSAGIFAQTASRRVVFLSEGKGQGPLSIYLKGPAPALRERLEPGMSAECGEEMLHFRAANLSVNCQGLAGWIAPPPSASSSSSSGQLERLVSLARRSVAKREMSGISALLPGLLQFEFIPSSQPDARLLEQAGQARNALSQRDPDRLLAALAPFYGLGPGLTPSGDDFIIGILLMLSRWQAADWEEKDLARLAEGVIEEAFRRTTAISASLIECAAGGQADLRLIQAADTIACGQPGEEESLSGLLGWGSSSGLDTLTGMAVAVLASSHPTHS